MIPAKIGLEIEAIINLLSSTTVLVTRIGNYETNNIKLFIFNLLDILNTLLTIVLLYNWQDAGTNSERPPNNPDLPE